jgi:hypothetical protein
MISADDLFEYYKDTLAKCGLYLLTATDELISYNLFEEFDIGVHSFLHDDSLSILRQNGLISEGKMKLTIDLRKKVIQLQESGLWNIDDVRKSDEWREVLILCDKINSMS